MVNYLKYVFYSLLIVLLCSFDLQAETLTTVFKNCTTANVASRSDGKVFVQLQCGASQETYRIVALGDGITAPTIGVRDSWRRQFTSLLNQGGYNFDMVGSQNTIGINSDFDFNHEAHEGYTAAQIASSIPTWMSEYTPHIALLHTGTLDATNGRTASNIIEDIDDIVDVLRAESGIVTIFVAKAIPVQNTAANLIINEMNSLLDTWVITKATAQSNIIIVDINTGFNATTDLIDGLHPNTTGETKMANAWYIAFNEQIVSGGVPTETPLLNECSYASNHPEWIFCEDFDDALNDTLERGGSYQRWHNYSDGTGDDSIIVASEGVGSSKAFRLAWSQGEIDAGKLTVLFGRAPMTLKAGHLAHRPTEDFREIYYRFYIKQSANFEGYPTLLAQARVGYDKAEWVVDSKPAMEHSLAGNDNTNDLLILSYPNIVSGGTEPAASGWNPSVAMYTAAAERTYANLNLSVNGGFSGSGVSANGTGFDVYDTHSNYHCIEVQLKINDPVDIPNTQGNGLTKVWIDGTLYHEILNQNFVENYTDYGINQFSLLSWWNNGSINAQDQFKYIDNLVISEERIGCGVLPQ